MLVLVRLTWNRCPRCIAECNSAEHGWCFDNRAVRTWGLIIFLGVFSYRKGKQNQTHSDFFLYSLPEGGILTFTGSSPKAKFTTMNISCRTTVVCSLFGYHIVNLFPSTATPECIFFSGYPWLTPKSKLSYSIHSFGPIRSHFWNHLPEAINPTLPSSAATTGDALLPHFNSPSPSSLFFPI